MNIRTLLAALAAAFVTLTVTLQAQVPQIINYQGRVAVGTVNFNGSGAFKFALVNAAGTIAYWSNDGSITGTITGASQPTAAVTLTVTSGLYSVLLGDTSLGANMTAIPNSVFANSDVRLRVWFNDGPHGSQLLTPDQRLAAVGYAMIAGSVANGAVGTAQLQANLTLGGTTTGTFSGNGAGLTNIPASAVTAPPPGMVLIPAGAFTMGNSVAADTDITDAAPVTTNVSAFYMDANLVTLSQWQSVYYWATGNGYAFSGGITGKAPSHPVLSLDWYDCLKWCNARSQRAGKTPVYYTDAGFATVYKTGEPATVYANFAAAGYRLPTEAEWEKAARGTLLGQRFPWGNTINQNLANYVGNTATYAYDLGPNGNNPIGSIGGSPTTSPVGSFAANGYGLYDMAGNVFEWCWDWYGTPLAGGTDPRGAATGSARVVRGGDWADNARYARCAYRVSFGPTAPDGGTGFRPVLPAN